MDGNKTDHDPTLATARIWRQSASRFGEAAL